MVDGDDRVLSGLEHRALAGLALSDGLFRPAAVGDVPGHDLDGLLALDHEGSGSHFNLDGRSVQADELLFDQGNGLALAEPLKPFQDRRA